MSKTIKNVVDPEVARAMFGKKPIYEVILADENSFESLIKSVEDLEEAIFYERPLFIEELTDRIPVPPGLKQDEIS